MACNLTTGEVEYIDKTIADLKVDNAKLVMKLNAEHLVRQNVERENAKLRELVRDMWRGCPVDERDCIACDFERDGMCDLFDRMRELGVDA